MNLDAGADDIFPLLCPVREYDWIQPWQCEMVYTDSGRAELDCVFKTNFPDDGPEDTWVVSRYEPPKHIEFVRINPIRSIRYSIDVIQQDDGSAQAIWKQVITGLNSEGDQGRIATHMLAFEGDSKVVWFEGNYSEYEADRKARLGAAADQPHRIKYRHLTRG